MITTLVWYMQDRMDEVLSRAAHAALMEYTLAIGVIAATRPARDLETILALGAPLLRDARQWLDRQARLSMH